MRILKITGDIELIKRRKFYWALIIALAMVVKVYPQGGPIQPEVTKFEPVDITDMVNLATGDFVYSIPLLEVLGPEGGYPISISYHSGIGPNETAGWVGLGWTLNPGSINRMINGYPDDYKSDIVQTHYEAHREGWGVGIGAGYGPVGLNVSYDSNEGFGGSMSIGSQITSDIGASISVGSNGASVGLNFSSVIENSLIGNSVGIGFNTEGTFSADASLGNMGVDYSSNSGNVSVSTAGFSSTTASSGQGSSSSSSVSLPIPFTPFSVSFYKWSWNLDETFNEYCYGYLYQNEYYSKLKQTADNKADWNKLHDYKFERQRTDNYNYSSQDQYSINSQGISGTFMPYFDTPYILADYYVGGTEFKGSARYETDDFNYLEEVNNIYQPARRNIDTNLHYRFLNDPGTNLISYEAFNNNSRWGDRYNAFTDQNGPAELIKYSSKKIEHIMDSNGKITGYKVTDSDGKIYEYLQPVYQHFLYSKNQSTENSTDFGYSAFFSKNATSWLLTAIKGPDYVDANNDNIINDGDWGYWVKFNYKNYGETFFRTPSSGTAPASKESKTETFSYGVRDYVLLNSIETETHLAKFIVEDKAVTPVQFPIDIELKTIKFRLFNQSNDRIRIGIPGLWKKRIEESNIANDINFAKVTMVFGTAETLPINVNKQQIRNIYEDIENNETILEHDELKQFNNQFYAFDWFKPGILFNDNTIKEKKLNSIKLYSKSDPNLSYDDQVNEWVAATDENIISNVNFDYINLGSKFPNHELNKGRYALRGINKVFGAGAGQITLPGYTFSYVNNNIEFNVHNWDRWGSYRSNSLPSGLFIHDTPQEKVEADKAKEWSLENIETPTGTKINIEYESDDYYHVNDIFDIRYGDWNTAYISPISGTKFSMASGIPSNIVQGAVLLIIEEMTYPTHDGYETDYQSLDYCKVLQVDELNKTIEVDRELNFESNPMFDYQIFIGNPVVYGGGLRVKEISSQSELQKYKVKYSYKMENGVLSSGTTCSLPPSYSDYKYNSALNALLDTDTDKNLDKYHSLYQDHKYSFGRPNPGVIYSRVVETKTSGSIPDNPQNDEVYSRKVYNFITSKDYPYNIEEYKYRITKQDGSLGDIDVLQIKNRSSIYGQPKKIEHYKVEASEELIREDEFYYAFSDEIKSNSVLKQKTDGTAFDDKPLGMIQEKYGSYVQYNNNGIILEENYIDNQLMQAYKIGTKTKQYFDNNKQIEVINKNYLWDVLSGSVIGKVSQDSKKDLRATETTPAHWKYDEMENKNMLTQTTEVKAYHKNYSSQLVPEAVGLSTSFSDSNIVSSEVTTWLGWPVEGSSDKIWRVNDKYQWVGDSYTSFTNWIGQADDANDMIASSWKRTSNITEYDKYSHPVEEKHIDGTYTSSIYGYGEALPVAIAKNARRNEINSESFEEGGMGEWDDWIESGLNGSQSTSENHTGSNSWKLETEVYQLLAKSFTSSQIDVDKIYRFSGWVKTSASTPNLFMAVHHSGGISYVGKVSATAKGDWEYLQTSIDLSSYSGVTKLDLLIRNGDNGAGGPYNECYWDDIRFHPLEATMSSYTYDPYTHKLTSITDENNKSTHFVYDSAGRLVKVLDQDKNIVTKNQYKHSTN